VCEPPLECPIGTCQDGDTCRAPGATFGSCNECTCGDDGIALCKEIACPPYECPIDPPPSASACEVVDAKCMYGDIVCVCQDPPGGGDGERAWACQINQ
jgi:hypothetical protein